ncbi:aminoglycoside phosphotransferase family protein, partial [Pararhodobacter sp. SW119]|uniref:aminoglycoside phosphotransferase family protein n=1 Tax=Pararhodobacter sp. SW119 TaxID=2780075 RepID=UPI001ADF7646
MLSAADRAVCARDPALPGLELILEAEAMAAALGLSPLAPAYLRYKPGVSCSAAFLHPEAGALAAHAYPSERYDEVRRRPEWTHDPSVLFLDAACMVVVPVRLDRQLRALRRFLDPDRRRKYLRRVIGRKESFARGEIELLRYKPGRRLVARIDWKGEPRAALKITGVEDFNRALIGATGAAAHGGAPLLGASSGYRALVTAWVPGEPICPEALGGLPDTTAVAETGAALARLHADPFRPAAVILPADDRGALAAVAEDLAALDSALARRADEIGLEIASRLGGVDYRPSLVHGDFSADQVVITKDRPVIIDWDHAACGDPARDIGTFLARLDAQAADGFLTQTQADELGAALLEGYARHAGSVSASIPSHHARALLLLASEGFRMRRPDWPERGHALVDRAAGLLSLAAREPRDPGMPQLDKALDPLRVLPEIAGMLGAATRDLRIAPTELVRHKPGRRALVRYRVEGANTPHVLGKLRAKGPDRRTPRVHRALRAAELDGLAAHGVGVPRALGQIESMNMWLQEAVPGTTLAGHLEPGDAAQAEIFARTGAALARLHDAPVATERRWSLDNEAAVLERALDHAAQQMPEAGATLGTIRRTARARLERLGDAPVCGIHRDFYFDQVLVDGPRIWLLDLDLYTIGDPAIDLANFLAHLDEFGLR